MGRFDIHGMANITGGGLRNLLRLKKGVGFEIQTLMKPQPIFKVLQGLGNVTDKEMYQIFNMGMGYCLVVPDDESKSIVRTAGKGAKVIGRAVKGAGVRVPSLDLHYTKY